MIYTRKNSRALTVPVPPGVDGGAAQQPAASVRQTQGLTRAQLATAVGLTTGIGLLQFGLSGHTDRYFAWTIKVPATAAFLGALYLGSGIGEALAARTRVWAYARIAVPSVGVFAGLTTAVTFAHLDAFHFGRSYALSAQMIAWTWMAVYLGFPTVSVINLIRQARQGGCDPPRRDRMPTWFRLLLAGQGVLMLSVGLALLLAPEAARGGWAWPLTDLTAQAIGAWGVGVAVGNLHAAGADDWPRVRVGMPALLAMGTLELIVLVRFAGVVHWQRPSAWILLGLLASMVIAGGYGTVRGWFWHGAGSAVGSPAASRRTLRGAVEAVGHDVRMSSYVSHTTVDCADAYALSVWWQGVLDYGMDPDDPNEPGHEECLIISPDGHHRILFIEVPDGKQVKNRIHFDLRPREGTRDEELARLLSIGATEINDLRRPDGAGWVVLADPDGNEFCILRGLAEIAAPAPAGG